MALSSKQQVFVDSYLATFNATQSALAAGYSDKTAYSQGARLLKHAEISEAISERLSESAMRADEVLMRLAEHARGDLGEYLTQDTNDDVRVDLPKAIEAKKTRLIKKLTQKRTIRTTDDYTEEDLVTSIEMYDAQAALVQLGRHHSLFVDRTDNRNFEIDLSKLTDDQLARVANGEDVMQVVLSGYIASATS